MVSAAITQAESLAERFKGRSNEFANAVGSLVADGERSMLPLFNSTIVRQANQEGMQVQARALLGENAQAEAPLFENGLVPSTDGLFWSLPG